MNKLVVRPLCAAGHFLYLPAELGVGGQDDEPRLATAAYLPAELGVGGQDDEPHLATAANLDPVLVGLSLTPM